jgi:hypothetical protein
MPKVKGVEMKVFETEGFAIRIAHPDGKDVRGDKANMRQYRFEKMAPNDNTVKAWKANRFIKLYARFDVQVLYADKAVAPGNTKLGTVRDPYLYERCR